MKKNGEQYQRDRLVSAARALTKEINERMKHAREITPEEVTKMLARTCQYIERLGVEVIELSNAVEEEQAAVAGRIKAAFERASMDSVCADGTVLSGAPPKVSPLICIDGEKLAEQIDHIVLAPEVTP